MHPLLWPQEPWRSKRPSLLDRLGNGARGWSKKEFVRKLEKRFAPAEEEEDPRQGSQRRPWVAERGEGGCGPEAWALETRRALRQVQVGKLLSCIPAHRTVTPQNRPGSGDVQIFSMGVRECLSPRNKLPCQVAVSRGGWGVHASPSCALLSAGQSGSMN